MNKKRSDSQKIAKGNRSQTAVGMERVSVLDQLVVAPPTPRIVAACGLDSAAATAEFNSTKTRFATEDDENCMS